MQTFLPYPNFPDSARVLDRSRHGKQRIEALEILAILIGTKPTWMSDRWWQRCLRHRNHPAVRMWAGHEYCLAHYGSWMCHGWLAKGHKDSQLPRFREARLTMVADPQVNITYPPWFGKEAFHSAHRAALLAKDFAHYSQFGWEEKPEINYVWPVGPEGERVWQQKSSS